MTPLSMKQHGTKFLELSGQQLEPSKMEDPLVVAARNFEYERDAASRQKADLVNRRTRLEGEIDTIKIKINELEMESSREFEMGWIPLRVFPTPAPPHQGRKRKSAPSEESDLFSQRPQI